MRANFAETLRSIVRSPISTMRPPRMSGLTCTHHVSVPTQALQNGACLSHPSAQPSTSSPAQHTGSCSPPPSNCRTTFWSSGAALVITISTSPRAALISVPNFSHTPSSRPRRLFSRQRLEEVLQRLRLVLRGAGRLLQLRDDLLLSPGRRARARRGWTVGGCRA